MGVMYVGTVVKNAVTTLTTMMRGRSRPNSKVKSAANKAGALVKLESGLGGSRVWSGPWRAAQPREARRGEIGSAVQRSWGDRFAFGDVVGGGGGGKSRQFGEGVRLCLGGGDLLRGKRRTRRGLVEAF